VEEGGAFTLPLRLPEQPSEKTHVVSQTLVRIADLGGFLQVGRHTHSLSLDDGVQIPASRHEPRTVNSKTANAL
jgi:hypothetical protein